MSRLIICILLAIIIATVRCEEKDQSDGVVNISGKLNIYGENEEITDNAGNVVESPLFQLPSMKIAREYLRRQIEKEKAQQKVE